MMKSEGFFKLRISHTCSSDCSVCDGRCTYTHLSHAHFLFVTYRHRVHAWLKVFAVCMSHISVSLSHVSSTILVVPARSLRHHVPVRTFFVELYPTQKRGSSAVPHERRGVWLLGRSHALHTSSTTGRSRFSTQVTLPLKTRRETSC